MPKYEVIRPWHGVQRGDVIETVKEINRLFAPNVRLVGNPARSEKSAPAAVDKKAIMARLNELKIRYDGKADPADLLALLPDGDPLKA